MNPRSIPLILAAISGPFKGVVVVSVLLALAVSAGCDKPPRLSSLGPDAVILAFGDSLTHGTGAGRDESYPARLGEELQRTVINAGVPGETSAEGVARLPGVLDEHRPGLVILVHGGNDFLRRHDLAGVAENLRTMIDLSRASGAEVVLVGVPQPGIVLSPPPFYQELADELGLPYEGQILGEILGKRELKSDAIHPNASGYALMAEGFARLIHEAGGI